MPSGILVVRELNRRLLAGCFNIPSPAGGRINEVIAIRQFIFPRRETLTQ